MLKFKMEEPSKGSVFIYNTHKSHPDSSRSHGIIDPLPPLTIPNLLQVYLTDNYKLKQIKGKKHTFEGKRLHLPQPTP